MTRSPSPILEHRPRLKSTVGLLTSVLVWRSRGWGGQHGLVMSSRNDPFASLQFCFSNIRRQETRDRQLICVVSRPHRLFSAIYIHAR
ncbi:hypothetical protein BJX61DRAFT_317202 [Aspergillus egyptiacus]|nr:hypothetical protein BJX61DRAFT_317202 [Aspergillus egyptiacus]